MGDRPTLRDEHQMLVSELRQNREIQLQTFSATPIWISLFFGLISTGGNESLKSTPILSLIPIPLLFIGLLLIVDRRHSSDVIIAYFRIAYDKGLANNIGWNLLLPEFRKNLESIKNETKTDRSGGLPIPQRFDFNVIVWLSYFVIGLACNMLYRIVVGEFTPLFYMSLVVSVVGFLSVLYWLFYQSKEKRYLLEAWEITIKYRESSHMQEARA